LPVAGPLLRFAAICAACFFVFESPTVHAQDPGELAVMHQAAMKDFSAGKWAEAAAGLEKVIAAITDPNDQSRIGPIHYTLGAAYFNGANYAKAVAAFNTFLTKYPNDARAGEARLALARATFLSQDYTNALTMFTQMEATPHLREQALLVQAECYKALEKPDDQMKVLERLIAPDIKTPGQATGALMLVGLYLSKEQNDKALEMINKLNARISLVDNVVALNNETVKLGDELAEKKAYMHSLAAYRAVRSRDQVISYQHARIANMERQIQVNLNLLATNQASALAVGSANAEIQTRLDFAKQLLEDFEKTPDAAPAILIRMGRTYSEWGKKWEAAVVFEKLRKDFPDSKEAESGLYMMIIAFAELNRSERTNKLCDEYLQKYPKGEEAATVGYFKGAAALQSGDAKGASTAFGTILTEQPDSKFREQMLLLLGNALFTQNEFAQARQRYEECLKEFPEGEFAEEAEYRRCVALVYDNKYEEALTALNAYVAKHPNGPGGGANGETNAGAFGTRESGVYLADAGYRIMVCYYAASQYDEIFAAAKAWHAKFPKDKMSGEVDSLVGDSYAAQGKLREAADAYIASFKGTENEDVLNYSMFEASKLLQKMGKWDEVAKMFKEFVQEHPDHPTVVAAMFWIGRALAREQKTEEAKTLLVEQLKRYINEPKREAVEQLLAQLAQLCLRRPPTAAPATTPAAPAPAPTELAAAGAPPAVGNPAAASPAPATPAPLPPYDPVAELKKQLAPIEEMANNTGKARVLYAQAELAKLRKKNEEMQAAYAEIGNRFKIEDLSPVMLAVVGDYLLSKKDNDRAAQFYANLREDFPKSDYLDYAYVGLGELAMQKQEYQKALDLFTYAADELASMKIKDATLGKGRALLEVGKYPEAKKCFEQVAGVKEWRGESTAAALYYLGETEFRQAHYPEAVVHYQRVFVAYQKFLPWVAKAYLRSAESFEKLGKRPEAVNHLKEMLNNEKLRNFPEAKPAEKMLSGWGVSV
jgi:TolA-binding protein